jgi:hypothetical protein
VKLIEAFHRTKWLASILNTTEQVNKHINVYQKWYQPKNQKQIYCFYAVPRGEEPKESNAGKDWFKEINLAEDLLNFKKNKNTALHFSSYPEKNLSSASETKKRNAPSSDANPNLENCCIEALHHHMLLHCSRALQHLTTPILLNCSQNPCHH